MLQDMLLVHGISGEDIIKQIANQVYDLEVSEKAKIEIIDKIGEFEFRLNQGGDPHIQLTALLANFALRKK